MPGTTLTVMTSTTLEPIKCQNGGHFDGSKCICPSGFNGDRCEFVQSNIDPVSINRTVKVDVVINDEYKPQYESASSPEYKEFAKNFSERMERYYLAQNIANFKAVVVLSIRLAASQKKYPEGTVSEQTPVQLCIDYKILHNLTQTLIILELYHYSR
ncbi:mucin-3B-like [Thalassophryne amazonica]|uniref:mucin-3B-like n=1 Tax=Thalassophryne amazonica TaxID=390379 RepID=UPI0014725DDC|nr:mucin-3B-like [Thalassophryne amazonica]